MLFRSTEKAKNLTVSSHAPMCGERARLPERKRMKNSTSALRKIVYFPALATVLFTGSTFASSYDFTTSPAVANCQATGGTVGLDWTGMLNESTSSGMYLDCGDTSRFTSGGNYNVDIYAWLYDRSTTAAIVCNASIVDAFGITWSGSTKSTSVSGAPGSTSLTWTSIGNYGWAYLSCNIPAKSGSNRSGMAGFDVAHNFT